MLRTAVGIIVPAQIDVVITEGANVSVTLPGAADAGTGRTITVRALGGRARIMAAGSDRIDSTAAHTLDRNEMATVISDGRAHWTIISSSDL